MGRLWGKIDTYVGAGISWELDKELRLLESACRRAGMPITRAQLVREGLGLVMDKRMTDPKVAELMGKLRIALAEV